MWRGFYYIDFMHLMDVSGVSAVIYSFVIHGLLKDPAMGANRAARLGAVNRYMKMWLEDNPGKGKLPRLLASNLVASNKWWELHGPAIKAATTRNSAAMFAAMSRDHYDTTTRFGGLVCEITSKLEEWYLALKDAGMFMSDAELESFEQITLDLVTTLQTLRAEGQMQSTLTWHIKPKSHKLCHLPLYASLVNPRFVGCYKDESHVGTVCKAWKASMSGRFQDHVEKTVLVKRFLGVVIRYEVDRLK
jgi:hypothetical protein